MSEREIDSLKKKVASFCEARDWDQFHNPKDLAIGLSLEAAELLEHFRFKTSKECEDLFHQPEIREEIQDELSDILFYILRFSQKYNVDLVKAFNSKIIKSAQKYPVESSRGSNKKHTEL